MTLKKAYRSFFSIWLMLVFAMGIMVLWQTADSRKGNLLEYLFTRPVAPEIVPVPAQQAAAPVVEAKPEPSPQPAPKVEPEWKALAVGKAQGAGLIHKPVIAVRDDGATMITFDYSGSLGEVQTFTTNAESALVVDILGKWNEDPKFDKRIKNSDAERIISYKHDGFLRVSGIRATGIKSPLKAEVLASSTQLRIVFSAEAASKHAAGQKPDHSAAPPSPTKGK